MSSAGVLGDYLEGVRQGISGALEASLPDDGPRRSLYDPLAEFLGRAGKALRPAICIAACRAFGGTTERVLPSVVSLELLHNAFLIHDDVEDGSRSRRGAPTIHEEHGMPIAVNVGDGLAALALQPLAENIGLLGTSMHNRVMAEYGLLLRSTIEGQAMELGWRRDRAFDLTSEDYLEMVTLKTCAYTTIYPLRVGALIGSWGRADLEALTRFGLYLGAAFQVTDDILNLTSTVEVYGKEIDGDLAEGKRTLMLIHLFGVASDRDREALVGFLDLSREERSSADIGRVREMIDRYGSLEYARSYAQGLTDGAREAFDASFGHLDETPDRRFLSELVEFVVDRAF